MKQLIFAISFFSVIQNSFAQTNYVDSLRLLLAQTTNSLERFDITQKELELAYVNQADSVDSASCIQLLKIAQDLKNDSLLAISYNWIGSYFGFKKGDFITGLEYYFKGLPFAEKAKDKRRISSLYFDIAITYDDDLGNPEEAFKNNMKGGENLPANSSPMYDFMLVQYQRNLSRYYLLKNQTDSALHYAQLVTETANRVKSSNFIFSALSLNGAVYSQKHDTAMADLYFKRANAMSKSVNINAAKATFYSNYIQFLLNTGRIKEAKLVAIQFKHLGADNNNNVMSLSAAGFMQQVYDSLHQIDSAYYYAKMKARINAEIFSQNNINKIQALAFKEQIRNLEEEAKERQAKEERQKNIQYALIALGIIIFVMLFLLLSRTIIVNERLISFFGILGLLVVFEFIFLLVHPWLAHFTNESPVLMLLSLVIIASLLIPLHHRLEHWIKEKMVDKNKAIRLAAAKKTIEKLEKKSAGV